MHDDNLFNREKQKVTLFEIRAEGRLPDGDIEMKRYFAYPIFQNCVNTVWKVTQFLGRYGLDANGYVETSNDQTPRQMIHSLVEARNPGFRMSLSQAKF